MQLIPALLLAAALPAATFVALDLAIPRACLLYTSDAADE